MKTSKTKSKPATTDGIARSDWNAVRAVGFRLVTALDGPAEERRAARAALRTLLAELRARYGRTPSLLATEADFLATGARRLALWREAYRTALAAGDQKNALLIAASLADYWTLERAQLREGRLWVAKVRTHLRRHPDRHIREEAAELSARLRGRAAPTRSASELRGTRSASELR